MKTTPQSIVKCSHLQQHANHAYWATHPVPSPFRLYTIQKAEAKKLSHFFFLDRIVTNTFINKFLTEKSP